MLDESHAQLLVKDLQDTLFDTTSRKGKPSPQNRTSPSPLLPKAQETSRKNPSPGENAVRLWTCETIVLMISL